MVLVLSMSFDDVLYLYQGSWKNLKGFQSYWADTISIVKFSKGHNSVKGSFSLHIVWWCFIFVQIFMNTSSTIFLMWSGHEMLSFELWPVWPWALSDIVEIWLLHIISTRWIFDPSFKKNLSRGKEDMERTGKVNGRLTEGRHDIIWHVFDRHIKKCLTLILFLEKGLLSTEVVQKHLSPH